MQRRDFCKLIAAATAARAIGVKAQAGLSAPAGFNKLHQTYEEFCATPEKERVFYALVDGKIVETKLDNSNWTATEWGQPPELPGGSWDGVPMQAPIEGLNGDGPYPGELGFAARIRSPRMVPRRQIRHLGALEPSVCARTWRLVRAFDVYGRISRLRFPDKTLWPSFGVRLQGSVRAMDPARLGTGGFDPTLQKCRSAPFHLAGQSP